jgi:protein-S-isoprenylcysteine O-methyltransferase Ste14
VGFVSGLLVHRSVPLPLTSSALRTVALLVGYVSVALALGCGSWAMLTFWRIRTGIIPHNPATELVVYGPYRFTRNPMYVSLTVGYIGLALILNTGWPIAFLPLVIVLLSVLVIRREEQYLSRRFPDQYLSYRRRVRRWL